MTKKITNRSVVKHGNDATRCPTSGQSQAGLKSHHYRPQDVMQRVRSTWGLSSYTPEFLIKEFKRMKDGLDDKHKPVATAIDREIAALKQFVK